MSLKAITWAWTVPAGTGHGRISPSLKLLLVALADSANEASNACWPSVARLAAMTGLGERSVRRLLPDLVASGLVTMDHQSGRNTRYTLQIGSEPRPLPYGQGCHTGRGANGTPVKLAPLPHGQGGPLPHGQDTPATVAPEPEVTVRKEGRTPLPPKGGESVAPPEWLDRQAWAEWCQYRRGRKWTALAANLSIKALEHFRSQGDDPTAVIHQSIAAGWTGLFALKNRPAAQPMFRNGFAQILHEQRQARGYIDADEVPAVNPFLIDTGSSRRDN